MRLSTPALMIAAATLTCGLLAQSNVERLWDQQHPDLAFWRDNVQVPLSAAGAGTIFHDLYQDAFLPPDRGLRFTMFTARILSLVPQNNPTELVVEMSDPGDPNNIRAALRAKLLFESPLSGTMAVGSQIRFKGVIRGYQLDPLQLNFEIGDHTAGKLEGWTGTK